MNYLICLAKELGGAWAGQLFCFSMNCDRLVAFCLLGLLLGPASAFWPKQIRNSDVPPTARQISLDGNHAINCRCKTVRGPELNTDGSWLQRDQLSYLWPQNATAESVFHCSISWRCPRWETNALWLLWWKRELCVSSSWPLLELGKELLCKIFLMFLRLHAEKEWAALWLECQFNFSSLITSKEYS